MRKFKTGDLLILKSSKDMGASIGATAICQGYSGQYIVIKWIPNALSGRQMNGRRI